MRDLPEGWVEKELGEVVTFQRGFDLPKKDRANGDFLLMVSNGQDGTHKDYKVKAPGIVTGRSGTLGKVFYVKEDFWPLNTTLWIKDFHGNNTKFTYYFLKKFPFEKYNSGSGVPTLNRNHIHPLPVMVPPLPEQKAIADMLSSFDDKIELLREQNKTLETLAQTIFKEWFVHFNFPDQQGKPYRNNGGEMVESELGLIPKDWQVGKLGEEFDIVMGQSPKGSSYNESGDGMVFYQGRAEFQKRFPKRRLYTTEPKRFAEKHDVLMSVRAPVGDINVASEKCCIGRGLAAIHSDKKAYALYKMISLSSHFDLFESEGTVFGSINKKSLEGIEVVIPSKEVINDFEDSASEVDKKIFNNADQIQTLSKTRDMLLPKLMSGQVRMERNLV